MEMHMTGKSVRVREKLSFIRMGDSRRPGAQLQRSTVEYPEKEAAFISWYFWSLEERDVKEG